MPRSNFSDLVKNPKMKLVLQDCGHLDSATLGKGYTLQVGVYKHCCTSGPSTWYRKAGISLMWWRNPKTATVDEMKRNFQSAGMVQVWAGTGQEANAKLNSSKYLRPGDIASMLSSDSAHGVMWTGEDWRSDAIQGTKPYPYSSTGRGGNQTFILWRHPALQEPGLSVQGDGLGNPMDGGTSSGFGGGSHEWPDFNFQSFQIMSDKNGQYTNEPLLLGIANHLRIEGSSGVSGAVGDTFGDGVAGSSPFKSPEEFLSKIDWNKCSKYGAGAYTNFKGALANRVISSVPSDFLSMAKNYSQKTGLPVAALILVGKSESGFKNEPKNSYGYGGYFGSKAGPEGSFDQQADTVKRSFETAKNNSPGADDLATLVLMYISHHLPAVGSKYWSQTNGKIWSADPDYIAENACNCWPPLRGKAVTLAEHIMCQLAAQYMALQLRSKSF